MPEAGRIAGAVGIQGQHPTHRRLPLPLIPFLFPRGSQSPRKGTILPQTVVSNERWGWPPSPCLCPTSRSDGRRSTPLKRQKITRPRHGVSGHVHIPHSLSDEHTSALSQHSKLTGRTLKRMSAGQRKQPPQQARRPRRRQVRFAWLGSSRSVSQRCIFLDTFSRGDP